MLLTLPALGPLARGGFFESHDGLFHVFRLAALDGAARTGVLYPRWFPDLAFGYGQPVLNYYGPLSYYIGLPFTLLGLSADSALKLVLAIGLLVSAVSMYRFARLHLQPLPSLIAGVVYAILPYHLLDIYVRGALAESLAFAWIPLALWAFDRLIQDDRRPWIIWAGLSSTTLAALLVTHSLSALIFAPVLAAYALLLLIRRRQSRTVGRMFLAVALAALISSFYWLPVLLEARYVGLGHGASQGYRDHLVSLSSLVSVSPKYPYALDSSTGPTFPLGLVQVLVLAMALVIPFGPSRGRRVAALFLVVGYLSAFMLTTASVPVWRAFEGVLALLQYPWRFQLLTALATAFLAGALVQRLVLCGSTRRAAAGLFLLLPVYAWALWRLPLAPLDLDLGSDRWVEAMWHADREAGQVGTTWTGEYLPIWVSEQRWALSLPVADPPSDDSVIPPGLVKLTGIGYNRYDLEVNVSHRSPVVLHQFHFPGWRAVSHATGAGLSSRPAGVLGLAAFDLPPVTGTVTLRLEWTVAQFWGTVTSIMSLLGLSFALVAQRRRDPVGHRLHSVWLAGASLLVSAILLTGLVWPHGRVKAVTQTHAVLERAGAGAGSVELLGFSIEGALQSGNLPGDVIPVTLYWRSLRTLDRNYKTFVHLTDAGLTHQPAQHDGDPGGGYTPTTRWLAGELVPDTHYLALPPDLPPGRYQLWAGMYDYKTVQNLKVTTSEAPVANNRVLLGEIEVRAP